MLVTFQSENAADVLMFERDARAMLKFMGRKDSIPGAMYPSEVSEALESLRKAINEQSGETQASKENSESPSDEREDKVSIRSRAFPLVRLLESADRDGKHVMWDGKPNADHGSQA